MLEHNLKKDLIYMNEAKAGLSRKEEDWVKSFSISTPSK